MYNRIRELAVRFLSYVPDPEADKVPTGYASPPLTSS